MMRLSAHATNNMPTAEAMPVPRGPKQHCPKVNLGPVIIGFLRLCTLMLVHRIQTIGHSYIAQMG